MWKNKTLMVDDLCEYLNCNRIKDFKIIEILKATHHNWITIVFFESIFNKNELTKKQEHILSVISEFIKKNAKSPTLKELKELLKYKNTSSVQRQTNALLKKGALKLNGDYFRKFSI